MRRTLNAHRGFWRCGALACALWTLSHLILPRSEETAHAQPPPCTLADTVWRTVDDFQLAPGQRAEAWKVWVAPNGDVYVVGFAEQTSTGYPFIFDGHWIVRKSSNGGQTWSTVRDFKLSGSSLSVFDAGFARNVGQALNGDIFVVGQAGDGSSVHWIVERSTNGGGAWTTVDDFRVTATANRGSLALDFVQDVNTGYLYVSGTGVDDGNFSHGIVRRSMDGGVTWSTVEDEATTTPAVASGILRTSLGEVVYVGSGHPNWIAKKSQTGNFGSWLLEDSFLPAGSISAQAFSLFRDAAFNIYAPGRAGTSSGVFTGFVRKSTDGGDNWSTIRQFQLVPGSSTTFTDGAWNPAGDIFLSIRASDGAADRWLVQRSVDSGTSWTTEDDFQLVPGSHAGAFGVASGLLGGVARDDRGNMYPVGFANDGITPASNHWVVRKINIACADTVLRGVRSIETAAQSGGHTCAIVTDPATGQPSAKCWGRNNSGQVGNGTTQPFGGIQLPTDVVGGGGFKEIDLGASHTCAITPTDGAACWGQNFFGQLGIGNNTDVPIPTNLAGLPASVDDVSGGVQHTCAVLVTPIPNPMFYGAVCWGRDGLGGALGNGPAAFNSNVPDDVVGLEFGMTGSVIEDISAGLEHTCAVVDQGAMCWGTNGAGQLGDTTRLASQVPVAVVLPAAVEVRQVSVSDRFSCALVDDPPFFVLGEVYCWGLDNRGQVGDGLPFNFLGIPTPVRVIDSVTGLPIQNAVQISAGDEHACARLVDGSLRCWGDNTSFQLGDQGACTGTCPSAVSVTGLQGLRATYVSAGDHYTCAVLENSIAACWGDRLNYRLGDGGPLFGSEPFPTAVSRP